MAHQMELHPRFSELDPYGHVNHAVYISYFEAARVELLREARLSLGDLKAGGHIIVVSEIHTKFLASARDGDTLVVETEVIEFRRVTSTWRQRIVRGDELIVTQQLRAALITVDGTPARFPAEMIAALEPYLAATS